MATAIDYKAMGRRIRAFRKEHGMTQAALAQSIGMSMSFIGHVERGTRNISIETLVKLSDTLDITLDMLVLGADPGVSGSPGTNYKMRLLNNVFRVLNDHSTEWLQDDGPEPKPKRKKRAKASPREGTPLAGGIEGEG